jgi:hypothetical protein
VFVVVVADKASADCELLGVSEHEKAGWAKIMMQTTAEACETPQRLRYGLNSISYSTFLLPCLPSRCCVPESKVTIMDSTGVGCRSLLQNDRLQLLPTARTIDPIILVPEQFTSMG